MATMARMPRGMLIRKAQRHPGPSVNQPPRSGPATEDTAKTAPRTPIYRPRSRAGTTSAIAAWLRIMRPPPPSPCTTRAKMRAPMSLAKAPRTEPMTNKTMATSSTSLRPNESLTLP